MAMKIKTCIAICLMACMYIFSTCAADGGQEETGDPVAGKQLFEQYCVLCHGKDGKLQMNGAKDLTLSVLSVEERIALMKSGKGLMTPFEGIITEEEMRSIASYAVTLKQQ